MGEPNSRARIARTVLTTVVALGFLLVLLPLLFSELNTSLGWPEMRWSGSRVVGGVVVVCGAAVIAHCTWLFARRGSGTTLPGDPPRNLVQSGLYRYSRNPIYVGDILVVLGVSLLVGGVAPLVYTLTYTAAMHALVVLREEPAIRRRFGTEYTRYASRVPRWLGPRGAPDDSAIRGSPESRNPS